MTDPVVQNGGAWTTLSAGSVVVGNGTSWVTPVGMAVQEGGVWVDTGYSGLPNAPGTPTGASGWQTTWGSLTVTWTASAAPPTPTHYRARLYAENNSTLLSESGDITGTLQHTFTVSNDTKYWVRIVAYLGTTPGPESGSFKVQMGHYTDLGEVWDWGALVSSTPASIDGYTSQYSSSYAATKTIDADNNTRWLSGGRSFEGGRYYYNNAIIHDYVEGFTFPSVGGNRKLAKVEVYMPDREWVYVGVRATSGSAWQGTIDPSTQYFDPDSGNWNTGDYDLMYHLYVNKYTPDVTPNNDRGGGSYTKVWRSIDIEGVATINLGSMDLLCLAFTNLLLTDIGGTDFCRGCAHEVLVYYRNWEYQGYHNYDIVNNTTW